MVTMETIAFSSGAVAQVRVMPPHVYAKFMAQFEADAEPEPNATVKRTTADGRVEVHPLTKDMEEYAAWEEEFNAWADRNEGVRKMRRAKWNDVMKDHCLVRWQWNENGKWDDNAPAITDPPDDWELSPALIRGGIKPNKNKRVDYIENEIVVTNLDETMFQWISLDQSGDLSEEEIAAQLAGFRPATRERWYASRRAATRGSADLPEHVSRRDGRGRGKGNLARRLVRWLKGR